MPQIPIPQDWDGVSWRCIQVEWPDSVQYQAILHGLLSYLMRGRLYDGTSGSILDALAVGDEIWSRNTPLTSCTGVPLPPVPIGPFAGSFGGVGGDCEDCEMPCINIAAGLKIENGKLYAKNDCCEWIEIGDLAEQAAPVDDPFYDPITPATYYGCGKAKAVLDLVYEIGAAVWDCLALSPALWVGHVKAAAPGYHLGTVPIIGAIQQAFTVAILYGEDVVFGANNRQKALCSIAGLFDDDGAKPTADDYLAAKTAIDIPWATAGGLRGAIGNFWARVLDTLGTTDFQNVAILGATDSTANCDCPDQIPTLPFPIDEMFYDVIEGMESVSLSCPFGAPEKVFNAESVKGNRIRGYGETTTNPNQLCDFDLIDEPGIAVLAGDELWALPSVYSKGATTSFNLHLGLTQHRVGGDTEAGADPFGDDTEVEAVPGTWSKLLTLTGDPATLTRIYGSFHWYADGENLDMKLTGLVVRRP